MKVRQAGHGDMTTTATGSLSTRSSKLESLAAKTPGGSSGQERDHMVTNHLGLVRKVCGKFRNSGEPMEDLIQVGSVGLLKAVDKYDPQLN